MSCLLVGLCRRRRRRRSAEEHSAGRSVGGHRSSGPQGRGTATDGSALVTDGLVRSTEPVAAPPGVLSSGQPQPQTGAGTTAMPTSTETFTGFRPEAIQFLADLAANNERDVVHAAQGRVRAAAQGTARSAVPGARRRVPGARHPARGRPDPIAVPDLSRRPVLQGQVPVQDQRRGVVPVGRGRRIGRAARLRRERQPGRLLPHGARRGLHRRRDVASVHREARRRSAPRSSPTRRRSAGCIDEPRFVETFGAVSGEKLKRVPTGLPGGPPGGRAAQAEGPDVRPAARR